MNRSSVNYRNHPQMISPITVRSHLRRSKRRVAVLATLLVIVSAVAAHHAMPDGMHMGMQTAAVCLAVVGLTALAVSGAIDLLSKRHVSWFIRLPVGEARLERPVRSTPARAGPCPLQVLRL